MATRATLRIEVRERLNEAAAGIWTDTELNSALAAAANHYGIRFPLESVSTPALTAGSTSTPIPTGGTRVTAVLPPIGLEPIERDDAPGNVTASAWERLTWRTFAGNVTFNRALVAGEAGTWRIEATGPRVMPTSDATTLVWPDSLLPALVARATGIALRTRFVDNAKRGTSTLPNHARLVADLLREADDTADSNRRGARGSVMR